MKYIYSLLILAFVSCSGETATSGDAGTDSNQTEQNDGSMNSSDLEKLITADLMGYFKEFNSGNWDAVMDKMYPGYFNIIPKERVLQSFSQMKGMGMEMKTNFNGLDNISEVMDHANGKFCRAYYDADLEVLLSGPMLANVDQIKANFSSSFDDNNIKFNEATNTINIKAKKSMIAASEDGGATWTYIDFNEAQMGLISQILPADVISTLIP